MDGGGCTVQLWDGGDRDYPTVRWRGDGLSNCGMEGIGTIQLWNGEGRDYPTVRWRGDGLSSCGME